MKNTLSGSEKDDRIKRNKDKDVMNRLNMLRSLNAFIGALIFFLFAHIWVKIGFSF